MYSFHKSILVGAIYTATVLNPVLAQDGTVKPTNPLLQKSTLQYQAPPFDKIKDENFKPAFEAGLKLHDAEIEKISNNPDAPTFANTVLALELSGQDLYRAMGVFFKMTSANTNPTLQAIEEEYAPIFSAHNDNIYLNSIIYKRIKALNLSALKGEDKKLVELYLKNFEMAGANLSDADKETMKTINQQLASLTTEYGNTLLIARKNGGLLLDKVEDLDGLSAEDIAAAKAKATAAGYDGKYLLGLTNTTQQPLFQYLKNRSVREQLFKASWTRA